MTREIGSEFWTERHRKGEGLAALTPEGFHPVYTLCGRTALEIVIEDILRERPAKKALLPSYCCHTMVEPFLRHGLKVEFYRVTATDSGIQCDFHDSTCEIVFLMDYFGFLQPETAAFAQRERLAGKTVIYDATHALFCEGVPFQAADYVFASCRKWLGVNAGFAAKAQPWRQLPELGQQRRYAELRNTAFDLKAAYILEGREIDKQAFLEPFRQAEELLETDYSHYAPDPRSAELVTGMALTGIRERRRANARRLMERLGPCEGISLPYADLPPEACPLFVPLMVKTGRDRLRGELIRRSVYLPVHWPVSALHRLDDASRAIYDMELSCVCDQRYAAEDMDHIAELLTAWA